MPTFPGQAAPETPLDSAAPTGPQAEGRPPFGEPEPSPEAHDVSPSAAAPGVGDAVAASPIDGQALPLADEADWLDRICPYLLSEDGSYRSTRPDDGHRCTAQDPPGTLPLAFQERFCLTDRHVRCEMFKYAQDTRTAALGEAAAPAEQVKSARFRPSVRSVPVAMGPSASGESEPPPRRPLILVAAGVGAFILFILIVILLSGGGGSGGGADGSPDPAATGSVVVAPTPEVTPAPTPDSQATAVPGSTPDAGAGPISEEQLIQYQVQEGEALLKIAETFATSRRSIIGANEGMADRKPYVATGDIIIVPASGELSIEELESVPGFLGLVE